MRYGHFIPENTAPVGAKRIGVYNSKGSRVGFIPLGSLAVNMGTKLYSFGAISDVHISAADSENAFVRALHYFVHTLVDFTVICGDLTNNGNAAQLERYRELILSNSRVPVNDITGNHDTYTFGADIETEIKNYDGFLYCRTLRGDDAFLYVGIKSEGALFTEAELEWLQNTLEENRNRRCFVFMHCFLGSGNTPTCGNANGMYYSHCWSGEEGQAQLARFKSLLAHYKNTVFFHGHSHLKFRLQEGCAYANFDDSEGFRSVHIPSVARPRQEDGPDEDTDPDYDDAGSEGYVVDVYEKGIHLRGVDFVSGEFLPIASYWIDTTPVDVEAGTFG